MVNGNSKSIISKSLVILIIIMTVMSYMPTGIGSVLNIAEAIEDTVQSNIDETLSYIASNLNPLDNWELICAVKGAGTDIHNSSVWILPEWNTGTITEGSSAGTYGSRIIGLIAMDKNPESIWGRNLINELILKQNEITGSFGTLLDQVYAMHALKLADADYNENLALECLIEQQSSDGGFGFSGVSDLDVTGMVLRLLANYTENSEVKNSISNSIAYIKASQLDSGGFESYGTENSNTIAVLISGLTSVGEDVQSAYWEKGGNNLADALNMFRLSDGSYKWKLDDLQPNNLATIQSLEALGDMLAGNSILNRLDYNANRIGVGLRIEGISETKFNKQVSYAGYLNPTVEDVLTYALYGTGISYEIEDSSYGPYLKSIDGETAGKFEGYDGWLYLLNGNDGSGIGIDTVKDGDEIVFYYGDFAPGTLIPEVAVSPEIIYAGDNITFTVSSTYFDWDTDTTTTTAIEGAKIEIGGKSYITDADGQVKLPGGTLPAGEYKYKVSKDVEGSVPAILRTDELSLTIKPLAEASVKLRIEGISETKFNKQVSYAGYPNPTVEDVLTYALDGAGISYEIEDSSYGPYLKSIDGETAGKFGGYDGWLYLLNGSDGSGIGIDIVKDRDEVVVYYGDFAPGTLIPEIAVSPEIIYVRDNITFTVSSTYFDWNTYTTTTTAIEGAKIEIGGKSYITDADGLVKLPGGTLSAGEYKYKVSKDVEGSVPAILRTDELSLTIKASTSTGPISPESFKVNVAVIGKDGEVIYGPRMVSVSNSDKYGPTALAALDATGLDCKIIDSNNGLFVEEIDGQKNEGMSGWMYAVNGKAPNISASLKDVSKGDEVLWWYSTSAAAKVPEWPGSSTGQAVTEPEQNEAIDKTPIDNKKRISFDDVDDCISWARDAIEILAGNGIIDGTGSGFEPQRPITRAEFIKIIVKALNLEIKDASGDVYNDVDKSEWFAEFVECASENNIITGYPDGKFRPNDVISRNEIAVILSRIIENLETLGSYDLEFQDAEGIPEWAKDGVKYAVMANLMKGYEDNTFKGEQPLTRAEAAVVIYRYLTEII